MKSFLSSIKKTILIGACLLCLFSTNSGYAAEGLQKLRVAYAAITAAFSIPWIAKEAGKFHRPGLGVALVFIHPRAPAIETLLGGRLDLANLRGTVGWAHPHLCSTHAF